MRKALAATILLTVAAAFCVPCFAEEGDAVLGQWTTEGGKSRVEITKKEGKYFGKIVWLREPDYPPDDAEAGKPKHDRNNPEAAKRSKPILGLDLLKDFRYSGKNSWSKGTIYDPENGKTYKCNMTLVGKNQLDVRGYIGISLIGRTTSWTRYVPPKEPSEPEPASEKQASTQPEPEKP